MSKEKRVPIAEVGALVEITKDIALSSIGDIGEIVGVKTGDGICYDFNPVDPINVLSGLGVWLPGYYLSVLERAPKVGDRIKVIHGTHRGTIGVVTAFIPMRYDIRANDGEIFETGRNDFRIIENENGE